MNESKAVEFAQAYLELEAAREVLRKAQDAVRAKREQFQYALSTLKGERLPKADNGLGVRVTPKYS